MDLTEPRLPRGWIWVDYDQPTICARKDKAGLDASFSVSVVKIRQWGSVPIEVRAIFDQRLRQVMRNERR